MVDLLFRLPRGISYPYLILFTPRLRSKELARDYRSFSGQIEDANEPGVPAAATRINYPRP